MLVLRSFSLSLSVFWRFLLVLPLWTVFYVLLTGISVIGLLKIATAIPGIGLLLMLVLPLAVFLINCIIGIHPYLIGIGIGLKVLGIKTDPTQKGLFTAAIGYGFVVALIGLFLSAVLLAISLFLIYGEISQFSLSAAERLTDPIASLSQKFAFGAIDAAALFNGLAMIALFAALLPVFAGAAAGRDPDGGPHSAMSGFGDSFLSMLFLLLAITGLSGLAVSLIGDAVEYVGLISVLTTQLQDIVLFSIGDRSPSINVLDVIIAFGTIVFAIWLFSLQCAAAALSYESRMGQTVQRKRGAIMAEQAESVDIAALLRSRMPKTSK